MSPEAEAAYAATYAAAYAAATAESAEDLTAPVPAPTVATTETSTKPTAADPIDDDEIIDAPGGPKGYKFRPVQGKLALVRKEPKLAPFENLIYNRYMRYENRYHEITNKEGSLEAFGDSYKTYGLHPDPAAGAGAVRYVEWAPSAKRVSLMGDFNDWKPWEYNGVRDGDPETGEGTTGTWTVSIPASAGLKHGMQVRVVMETEDGRQFDRIPAWIQSIAPCSQEDCGVYHNGIYYDPPEGEKHAWKHEKPRKKPKHLRIYEAHVGMSSEEERHGTYREFADDVLPRIKKLGYNTVQMMVGILI